MTFDNMYFTELFILPCVIREIIMEPTAPTSQITDDEILQHLATDYAQYITPRTKPDVQALDDSIDELLTKLDEYCGLVDIVRSDTTLCLNRTLPEIQKKSEAMKDVFKRVDQLEVFVGMVKAQVATVEGLLDQAESEMSTSTVKKFLSAVSLFGRKSQPKTERHLSKFEPPELFKTEDFFPKQEAEAEPVVDAKGDSTKNDNLATETNETKQVEEMPKKEDIARDSETEEKKDTEVSDADK